MALFTKTAKRLKVKGLTADETNSNDDNPEPENVEPEVDIKEEPQEIEGNESVLDENIEISEEDLMAESNTTTTTSDRKVKKEKKPRKSSKSPELTETVTIEKGKKNCPSCNFEAKNYQSMKTHMASKHKQRAQFKCNKCEDIFEESNKMIIHYKQEHKTIKPPKNQFFNCHLCTYKSLKEENLERHLKFTYHENEASVQPAAPSTTVQEQEQAVDLELD